MRLTPGTRLGPYEVVALLGSGGMAVVYRAKDTRLGRDVAIKVVSEALGSDGPFLERFEREAKLAASLSHPNVVALHDVGFHEGKPYFVTELLQGESLRERLAKGPIPLASALEWAAQMAQGLAAAHERGIVHRDLKPENVFLTKDGHLKLIDFGIAKLVEVARDAAPHVRLEETVAPSGSSTGTGMVLGTPGYMSPEQVRGDVVDARTDFFSLGTVLYEMLSGHRAFPSSSVVESGYAILHAEPEPLPATIPPAVAQVVRRCLEKDAARRFQSARDLAFHLELLRAPTGSGPVPAALAEAPVRHRARRWAWPVAATLSLLALGALYLAERSHRPPMVSVEQITFRQGTVWNGRFTPDGRVIFSAGWGADADQLFSRAPSSPESLALGVHGARLLSVSAQGELAVALNTVWYAPMGAGGTLAVVPEVGGAPREISGDIVSADWSPSGELAAVRYQAGKRQLEYPVGKVILETAGVLGSPRVSPSGDSVAVFRSSIWGGAPELVLVDKKGGVRKVLEVFGSGLAWAPSGTELWFTEGNNLFATTLSGKRRLVFQSISPLRLEDISRDGKVLVNVQDERHEIAFLGADSQHARDLPFLNYSILMAVSADGRRVLFTGHSGDGNFIYLRPSDGSSAPLKLGRGQALDFSPDGKTALGFNNDEHTLLLFPIGIGVTRTIPLPGLTIEMGRYRRGGRSIVVTAHGPNETEWRLYNVPLDGGAPTLLSKEQVGPFHIHVSPDDRFVAANAVDLSLTLYPLDGSASIPVRVGDSGSEDAPVGWSKESQLWFSDQFRSFRNQPTHVRRYDVPSQRIVEERTIGPNELAGLAGIGMVTVNPDGKAIAFGYVRMLGVLYLLDGLGPPH